MKTGVLLVNLGTPSTPSPRDVKRYLTEFLTDGRVIDLPPVQRNLLVRGIIIPKRYRQSAALYKSIWEKEGSPLLIHGKKVEGLLQKRLGEDYRVRLAMRYQSPSIEEGLKALMGCQKLVIFPMFPQYASATTGSVHQKVFEILSKWAIIPEVRFISQYPSHPHLIEAFAKRAEERDLESYDHFVFSYHGLPQRQILKGDQKGICLKEKDCCQNNPTCYASQCFATTREITKKLRIPHGMWSHTYQSRLGKSPWIEPYTDVVLQNLAIKKKKRVLVFCPSFVADCLETLEEIGSQYRQEFQNSGGETLDLVKGLNDHPKWIETIESLIHDNASRTSLRLPSER
ncbi:ferrochelatase [Candidatus Neptunichlamydia sp. REUL1]|uniref:ferrochelatase n=1 Tax=Candidatus Neptunichlamydia sp. REUL1 TaxID=3064277 RepID=UPI002930E7C9|nr:ferrochelatase [Candidatus Neptunochlamydia sp. REUL1]